MAPKGLPKSGAGWDFGEGGLWESAKHKQAGLLALALAPWMGVSGSIQMPRAEKGAKAKGPQKTLVLRWFTVVYKIPLL